MKDRKATHKIPSGLGGIFEVVIIDKLKNDRFKVEIINPQHDFHGQPRIVGKDELIPLKSVLKRGDVRFYFPEFPDHPFNGCFAHSTGAYLGEIDGKKVRREIGTFENTMYNQAQSSGYWKGEVEITADDFKSNKVLVKQWFADGFMKEPEYFYLVKV